MSTRPLVPMLAVLAAAVALAACGQAQTANTDAFAGDQKAVAEAVYAFRDAVARRDEAKVCDSFLTAERRDELVRLAKEAGRGSTCAAAVEDTLRAIDATDIEILQDGITVTGKTATVKIRTNLAQGEDPVDTLTLAEERGWRISELPAAR